MPQMYKSASAALILEGDNMNNVPTTIDTPVPVNFKIERNGTVNLSVQDYTTLLTHSKTCTLTYGKNRRYEDDQKGRSSRERDSKA